MYPETSMMYPSPQGPPGTGKTRTLLALIRVLCTAGLPEGRPILATADTNAAVDNVVEGLAGCGVRVVRVGLPAKVRPSLEPLTLESLTAKSPEGIKVRHTMRLWGAGLRCLPLEYY